MNARAPGRRPRRLGGRARRYLFLLHIAAGLGWLGVDIVIGVLAFTGYFHDDPRVIAACYTALSIFAVPVLLAVGLTSLTTGILYALGTGRGLLHWWWVTAKLCINLVLTGLVPVALLPRVREAAAEAEVIDPSLTTRLAGASSDLLFPPVVSGVALVTAAVIATAKPWGLTPHGRRRAESEKGRLG
jgi:hypothetical protein